MWYPNFHTKSLRSICILNLCACFDINWHEQYKKPSEGNEGRWLKEEEYRSLEWARISTFRELMLSTQARQPCSPNDVVKPHKSPSIRTNSISNSGRRLARQDYWKKAGEKRRETRMSFEHSIVLEKFVLFVSSIELPTVFVSAPFGADEPTGRWIVPATEGRRLRPAVCSPLHALL